MRVLHVIAPGDVGGLERVVQLLACGQRCAGDDVHVATVLSSDTSGHPLLQALRAGGITTHPIVIKGRGYWRERAAMLDLVHRVRPEVVHTHGYRPDLVDGGVARKVQAAAVTTVHGFTRGSARNRLYEWLQRRAARRFDAVVAVSRPLASELAGAGIPSCRLHLVVNAWGETTPPLERAAARQVLGIPVGVIAAGWVGRMSHEKGLDVLIDALPHLAELPIQLHVVGDGAERAVLELRARRIGMDGMVRWHGIVPDASRLFRAFDLFVLSSRTEGTPMVLYEAMAAGVPIVATAVGGVPDMVADTEALLVPAGSAGAIAQAIRLTRQERQATSARVRAAQCRLARDAAVERWVGQYRDVYAEARVNARNIS